MPTIFTPKDVQKYTRWQRFKMWAKIRNGCTWDVRGQLLLHYESSSRHLERSLEVDQRFKDADADQTDLPGLWLVEELNEELASARAEVHEANRQLRLLRGLLGGPELVELVAAQKATIEDLTRQRDDARNRADTSDARVAALERQAAEFETRLSRACILARGEGSGHATRLCQMEMEDKERQFYCELYTMRQSRDAKTQELEEKTRSVQALEAKVQALEAKVQALEAETRRAPTQKLKDELAAKTQSLEDKTDILEALRAQYRNCLKRLEAARLLRRDQRQLDERYIRYLKGSLKRVREESKTEINILIDRISELEGW